MASASTAAFHGNTTWPISVGSPAASDLVVVAAACAALANDTTPSITTPAGWTRETFRASANTFYEQAVYWKIASGSEGASVNFTVSSGGSLDCGARYWKFTGYDSANPIDATDIAWADTFTPNPPSQSVTGGPLDVYVLAFASDRGDNTYSAGSDLTTNAHTDAGGISSGRSIAVSYGAYTSISSKDPGTFTFTGGSFRTTSAVTAVIYPATSTFSVAPVYATVSNTAISATFTATSAGQTYYCALYAPGATAPTAAQLQAGTGAHSAVVTGSTTGSSESHNMTASDSPTFPKYDPYCVINSGTVATTSTTQTTPPTTCGAAANEACQYVTLTSVAIGGIASVATLAYDGQTANFVVGEIVTGTTSGAVAKVQADTDAGATGTLSLYIASGTFMDNEAITGNVNGIAVVNGTATYIYAVNDVLVAPTKVQPGNVTLTIASDGNAIYSTTGVQTATNVKIYDYSAVAYASGDIDWVDGDTPPACGGDTIVESLIKDHAMTSFDLDALCTDAEGDTLNSIAVGTQPTGVSLNGTTNAVSGTPTVLDTTGVTIRYVVYDTYGALGFRNVFYTVSNGFTMPDCLTVPTTFGVCSSQAANGGVITVSVSYQCDASVTSGNVISQIPDADTVIVPGDTVYLIASRCGVTVPACVGKTVASCQTLMTENASTAVLTLGTGCAASNDSIYSQSPAARTKQNDDFTLLVYCH